MCAIHTNCRCHFEISVLYYSTMWDDRIDIYVFVYWVCYVNIGLSFDRPERIFDWVFLCVKFSSNVGSAAIQCIVERAVNFECKHVRRSKCKANPQQYSTVRHIGERARKVCVCVSVLVHECMRERMCVSKQFTIYSVSIYISNMRQQISPLFWEWA